jgi:hypothetical protein
MNSSDVCIDTTQPGTKIGAVNKRLERVFCSSGMLTLALSLCMKSKNYAKCHYIDSRYFLFYTEFIRVQHIKDFLL